MPAFTPEVTQCSAFQRHQGTCWAQPVTQTRVTMHTKMSLVLEQMFDRRRRCRGPPPRTSFSFSNYLAGVCGLLRLRRPSVEAQQSSCLSRNKHLVCTQWDLVLSRTLQRDCWEALGVLSICSGSRQGQLSAALLTSPGLPC